MQQSLFVAGSNAHGQLATNCTDDAHSFTQVVLPRQIAAISHIACGANHTLLLDGSGGLYGSGDGQHGQLGPISSSTTFQPLKLPFGDRYTPRLFACSWASSYVVLSAPGTTDLLVSFGANDFGALGVLSPKEYNTIHIPIDAEYRIEKLVAGPRHVLVVLISQDKTYTFGWGASRHGQLGEANMKQPFCPLPVLVSEEPIVDVAVGFHHTVLLHRDHHLIPLGSNKKRQLEGLLSPSGVSSLGCTWNGTYVLSKDGLHATGANSHCQLPDPALLLPSPPSSRPNLVCGSEHVLYSIDHSKVFGWGWNEHGNLGQGHTTDLAQPQPLLQDRKILGFWAGCATTWIAVE